ncbi:MAG: type III pantothenate kinase [Actinomycetota bacterium]|nr:type III pantothenate kinase [Actinomycetota bacterium]
MLLAVDVGNTQTHLGVFDSERLAHEWRAATDPRRSADELALMYGEFLRLVDMTFEQDVTGLAVCSVVPRATQELRELARRYLGFDALVVEPGVKTGVAIKTDNPREIGADRIADVVGAREIFPDGPVIVVDFGTAIKVEAITAQGEFLGGAIAPGIDTAATALFSATAQLRRVELVAPPRAIGRSTVTALQSGIVLGTAALVDGLIERVSDELGGRPKVVATGGLAPVVADHCRRIDVVEPILTLMGLRLIFERNTT